MQQPTNLDERYVIEFIEDSGWVYKPGQQKDATEFIEDYCECNPPELDDVSEWLRSIPISEAVAFIAEAWGIQYKLHTVNKG